MKVGLLMTSSSENTEKHVSKIALFYDLVFVYMISKTSEILHHLSHGRISIFSFMLFAIIVLIFISSWMTQTIFTNRYGKGSWSDIAFYFIDMMILLFMSNSFDTTDLREMRILLSSAGLLSTTLALHYLITYFQVKKQEDKKITISYFRFLIFRAICLFTGGYLDNIFGFSIAIIGLALSWIMPSLTKKYTVKHPIHFGHFLERLNLLVIVIFGETIIGIADYFRPTTFNFYSIFIFLLVAFLFFTYILQFDYLIQEDQPHATGNALIYLHYAIIFGISLVTASLKIIHEKEADSLFTVCCLFAGIALIYLGLLVATRYNQKIFALKKATVIFFTLITLIGFLLCVWLHYFPVVIMTSFFVVTVNVIYLVKFSLSKGQKKINV